MSYYITANRKPNVYQITYMDVMFGVDETKLAPRRNTDTITWSVDKINRKLIEKTNFEAMQEALSGFVEQYKDLIAVEDKSTLYRSFKIPKRSGGLRQIDAPNDELKRALYDLKTILEKNFYISYHTAAFAYVHGRSTIDSVKRHQQNHSRWFLKTDMKNFFPSTSPEFLMKMLCMSFPFCEFVRYDFGCRELLEKALSLCFLNGGLPQGTPTSPMLTNAMMIPIDNAISKMCHEHHPHLCYTRYADDMLISSEYTFNWTDVRDRLISILKDFEAPFSLHPDKTRFGSSSGSNWNLGVMLNAENKITIGHEKKKVAKACVFQFMQDYAKSKPWCLEDAQHLAGQISYYKMVEPEFVKLLLGKYTEKFGCDVMEAIKTVLRGTQWDDSKALAVGQFQIDLSRGQR